MKRYYVTGFDALHDEPSELRQSTALVLGKDYDTLEEAHKKLKKRMEAADALVQRAFDSAELGAKLYGDMDQYLEGAK